MHEHVMGILCLAGKLHAHPLSFEHKRLLLIFSHFNPIFMQSCLFLQLIFITSTEKVVDSMFRDTHPVKVVRVLANQGGAIDDAHGVRKIAYAIVGSECRVGCRGHSDALPRSACATRASRV